MISILLQLRTAAMNCSDKVLTDHLRSLADEMAGHLTKMQSTPCGQNMQEINGCFARAHNALKASSIPPAPSGGAITLTQEQLAA